MSSNPPLPGYQAASISSLLDSDSDDDALKALGYAPSFTREFSNLATISFAFSIMGVCSSVASTFNTPLLLGGPASVTWCWLLGGSNCVLLEGSIAEIVSAYPTCGGLYTASAKLCPRKYRARVGWVVGWLNILGQFVGLSSTEFGLANMILAAVVVARDDFVITPGKAVRLTTALLFVHGILNSLRTRHLALLTSSFLFVNMHPASYVFGSDGLVDGTGGWGRGMSFLLGLLTYAAPATIAIATLGTLIIGWLLNITLILVSGPLYLLPGPSGSAFLAILSMRLGRGPALALWSLVCLTAFCVCQSGLQAGLRTIYAFSRDGGLPDGGYFARVNARSKTPIRAVWLTVLVSVLPGLLDLASPIAAMAIFAMISMSMDLSYIVPIILRRLFHAHPEVQFVPGPFALGNGVMGWVANWGCVVWTLFGGI
ncbi:hypothetical protein SERLADRAFT_438965 [Serpula lacrymans var. lacrymans S7.9]|uniref:Amino acid permease/ SLC12A domain-containing protein n=1 Tax=Serpula lacrymans var. lacrymans (strain S7.9) TaxID=578457 RepID=F8NYI4_SERL9|nr:uncharacterized protein SERLADRAFT_438965 [Serpula lacrymans var. lacrymans S7.9]EGO23655.1 hypothetical protein SERLADRAFT_438965 [Serpula lacrymans var. lacrymans S7.9]